MTAQVIAADEANPALSGNVALTPTSTGGTATPASRNDVAAAKMRSPMSPTGSGVARSTTRPALMARKTPSADGRSATATPSPMAAHNTMPPA